MTKMEAVFYIGFFMVNFWLSVLYMNHIQVKYNYNDLGSGKMLFMVLIYSLGITMMYYGVFR